MQCFVPQFELELEEEDTLPSSNWAKASLGRSNPNSVEDELLELVWRNGPVAQAVQGDRHCGWSPTPAEVFMEEDEMASWLHCQIGEEEDGGGELYPELLDSQMGVVPARPAVAAGEGERTVVDFSETPELGAGVAVPVEGFQTALAVTGEQTAVMELSGEAARGQSEERKRKSKDPESQSEDVEFISGDKRKEARRSTTTRRTRAAEVHNLSERRRRDRINEKMKALQELIPRCNKSDKASMLDEAIEYLKSLQLQVQMMSMGCSMGPMMFPGVQTYLPPMGMGMGMGLTMGLETGSGGMGRPMMPFGPVLPCSPMVGPPLGHLVPRALTPQFYSPNIITADQLRVQASNMQDPASSSISMLSPNAMQIPNVNDCYHHYIGVQQLQSRAMDEPRTNKGTGITEKFNSG